MHSSASTNQEQKNDYNHVVDDLQDYMLTSKLIAKHSSHLEFAVGIPQSRQDNFGDIIFF